MTIYDRIKAAADAQGKTIKTIEKEAGLGNGAIGKWEKSSPMTDNLAKVAAVLGVSIDDLIKREG